MQFYVSSLLRLPCQSVFITVANFKTFPETRDSVALCEHAGGNSHTSFIVCQARPSCVMRETMLSYLMSRFVITRNSPQLELI